MTNQEKDCLEKWENYYKKMKWENLPENQDYYKIFLFGYLEGWCAANKINDKLGAQLYDSLLGSVGLKTDFSKIYE